MDTCLVMTYDDYIKMCGEIAYELFQNEETENISESLSDLNLDLMTFDEANEVCKDYEKVYSLDDICEEIRSRISEYINDFT